MDTLKKAIVEPVWEFLDRGGKRWRPSLFLLICEVLGKKSEEYLNFAIIPEVIHNGTLIIDDIEDISERRRGKPCTYRIYGLDIAVNAGNAMYYLPLLPLMEQKHKIPAQKLARVYEVYVQEMINLSLGQAMDIAWHRGLAKADTITEQDYLQMCAYKTGTLARMAAEMAAVLSDADDELVNKLGQFAENIGVAFQVQDDILDLTSAEFTQKKGGRGQDITEGKRSLMVIHTLRTANTKDSKRLIELLNMHASNQKLRDEAICLMQKYGSIEYAQDKAKKMVKQGWNEVERQLSTSDAKEMLKAFADFLIGRKI
jgi:geranylgeranyl pyrophosphate synthase